MELRGLRKALPLRDVFFSGVAKARMWIDDLVHGRANSFSEIASKNAKVSDISGFLRRLRRFAGADLDDCGQTIEPGPDSAKACGSNFLFMDLSTSAHQREITISSYLKVIGSNPIGNSPIWVHADWCISLCVRTARKGARVCRGLPKIWLRALSATGVHTEAFGGIDRLEFLSEDGRKLNYQVGMTRRPDDDAVLALFETFGCFRIEIDDADFRPHRC